MTKKQFQNEQYFLNLKEGEKLHEKTSVIISSVEKVANMIMIDLEYPNNEEMIYTLVYLEGDIFLVESSTAHIESDFYTSLDDLINENMDMLTSEKEENDIYMVTYFNHDFELAYTDQLEDLKNQSAENEKKENHGNYIIAKIEKMKECQRCGKEASDLEILGLLTACEDCEKKYHDTQERADKYINSPYDEEYYSMDLDLHELE